MAENPVGNDMDRIDPPFKSKKKDGPTINPKARHYVALGNNHNRSTKFATYMEALDWAENLLKSNNTISEVYVYMATHRMRRDSAPVITEDLRPLNEFSEGMEPTLFNKDNPALKDRYAPRPEDDLQI
jgi:hypothetical protein